jgi:hypothetical protein
MDAKDGESKFPLGRKYNYEQEAFLLPAWTEIRFNIEFKLFDRGSSCQGRVVWRLAASWSLSLPTLFSFGQAVLGFAGHLAMPQGNGIVHLIHHVLRIPPTASRFSMRR